MTKALYAGTFDPPTNGHLWMIERGAALFDELVVAVGVNPEKRPMFPLQARIDMLRQIVAQAGATDVTIDSFENLYLVDYARQIGANFILRGIRNEGDYMFERSMRNINGELAPAIDTVFLMPPKAYSEVSSSFVKGLIGPRGWPDIVKRYVPPSVMERILAAAPVGSK